MIHSISSNQPSFRTVEFTPGFNLILADRSLESTRGDSRNGLGKSTLIEIIHFCLGSSNRGTSAPFKDTLREWIFTLDISIGQHRYKVSRSTGNPGKIYIEGDTRQFRIQPEQGDGQHWLRLSDWNLVLGNLMFGLPIEQGQRLYSPSFRSLISYFIRRGPDSFSSPFSHFRRQKEWDIQVHNAFLLGLGWEKASEWQSIKDKEKVLTALKAGASVGAVQGFLGSVGELASQIVLLESEVSRRGQELREFRVHPQYRQIEDDANARTEEIHKLSNQNVADRRLLKFYQDGFAQEEQPRTEDVVALFRQVQVELPDLVRRRLEDVQAFHARIIENRQHFLSIEVERLTREIASRDILIRQQSEQRAESMSILRSHGALDEFIRLQQLHTESVSHLEDLRLRLNNLRSLEEGRSALRIGREILQRDARIDYDERRETWGRCVNLFNDNSQALYDAPGRLVIDLTRNGFRFDIEIARAQSQGVTHMKVFCYDLMLAQFWSERQANPGILVHDSTVFDGVDERQVAHALERAASESERHGFQYICTMNSDTLPLREFSQGFDVNRYVRLRLTDRTPSDSLLGIRF